MTSVDIAPSSSHHRLQRPLPGPHSHLWAGALIKLQDPVPYPEGWAMQRQLHAECVAGVRPDTLVLLEHLPVYTMGRRTKAAHLGLGEATLRKTGALIQSVNRGGSITYHGPGQLVGYPILTLSRYAPGPRLYVWLLEEMLIRTLALWEIAAHRIDGAPGIWVRSRGGEAKIASIGVRVERGVTLHGFALNVDLDLTPFSLVVPCGLEGCRTTTIAQCRQAPVSIRTVTEQVAMNFSTCFNVAWLDHSGDLMRPVTHL